MSNRLTIPRGTFRGVPLDYLLKKAGLGPGLQMCLDAGDDRSYTTGQTWFDRSGVGSDMWLGASVGATSSDPTFNGVAGGRTAGEYFSHDGGDYFFGIASSDWMNRLHQDNALFTLAMMVWLGNTNTQTLMATNNTGAATGVGIGWFVFSGGTLHFRSLNSDYVLNMTTSSLPNVVSNQWVFLAVTINEAGGAGASAFYYNGSSETFNGAYSSPSAAAAGSPLRIGARISADTAIISSGSRIAMAMAWEGRALTVAELQYAERVCRLRNGV